MIEEVKVMNKKIIFVILSFVALIAIGSIAYVVLSDNIDDKPLVDDNNEDKNIDADKDKEPPKVKKDSISLKSTKKSGDKIINTYALVMNNKEKTFEVEFSYESHEDYSSISGKGLDIVLYNLGSEDNIESNFTESNIKKLIDEEKFKFIKGKDGKTYLGVIAGNDSFVSGYTSMLYIFNDELEMLTGDLDNLGCGNKNFFTINTLTTGYMGSKEPGKSGYDDSLGVCQNGEANCHVNVKIEDDKIYVLYAKDINALSDDGVYGTLEERIYTINNNKFNYKVNSTDTITDLAGQAC